MIRRNFACFNSIISLPHSFPFHSFFPYKSITETVVLTTIFVKVGLLSAKYCTTLIPLFDFICDHCFFLPLRTFWRWKGATEKFLFTITMDLDVCFYRQGVLNPDRYCLQQTGERMFYLETRFYWFYHILLHSVCIAPS